MSDPITTETDTPVPVPPGTATNGTIKQIVVRRKAPGLTAVCYDGTNAVQVAGWLMHRGMACKVSMQPGTPPVLLTDDGRVVEQGWVLPNLEVITPQELGTIYEAIQEAIGQ